MREGVNLQCGFRVLGDGEQIKVGSLVLPLLQSELGPTCAGIPVRLLGGGDGCVGMRRARLAFFRVECFVCDIHVATSIVDSAKSFVVGEEFRQGGLVGDCCGMQGFVVVVHGDQVEGTVFVIGDVNELVDVVVQLTRCKVRFTIYCEVDGD